MSLESQNKVHPNEPDTIELLMIWAGLQLKKMAEIDGMPIKNPVIDKKLHALDVQMKRRRL